MRAYEIENGDAPALRQAVGLRRAYKPLYVEFKLLYGCRFDCAECRRLRPTQPPPLTMMRLRAALDEVAALGCRAVHFSGGEPLLRPQVTWLVGHAVEQGMQVTLTTNGNLLDEAVALALVDAGLRVVNLTLDSPDERVHDAARGEAGAWQRATRAVRHLRRYAGPGELSVRIHTVVGRANYASLAGLPQLACDLGADALHLIPADDHLGAEAVLAGPDLARYNAEVAPALAEAGLRLGLLQHAAQAYPFGGAPAVPAPAVPGANGRGYYARHPCYVPWTHTLIDYNGLVYVCGRMHEQMPPLGDIKRGTFAAIWRGPAYDAVRAQMHPPALAMCGGCSDFVDENHRLLQIVAPGAAPTAEPA